MKNSFIDGFRTGSETVYLIDISSFIFRAYYSVGHLSRKDGTPTGAVFGVANMLVSLLEEHSPEYIGACMDSRTPTFRREMYPEYKANRPPPPDDLKVQFPLVSELVDGFCLNVLQKDGFEADDIIATVAKSAVSAGLKVVIVSGDKDLMQLVGDQVVVFDTMKDKVWDSAAVEEKWGVPPELLGDLLALAGDSSDNIPGVPRVGPKTAAPLLVEWGGLENLLQNRDSLKSKALAKRLAEHESDARLSRDLVQLKDDIDLGLSVPELKYEPPAKESLGRLLDRFELTKLKIRLCGADTAASPDEQEEHSERTTLEFSTVNSLKRLEEVAELIRKAGRFAVDLETTSVNAVEASIVGVALAWDNEAVYVPVAHKVGPKIALDDVLRIVAPLLEDKSIEVIAQNVKYEDTIFRRHGIRMEGIAFDPMLASYLVRSDSRSHKLDTLSVELLGHRMITYDEVTNKSRGHQLSFDEVAVDSATAYSAEDALMALWVANEMEKQLDLPELKDLLFDVEIPLARVLCTMELEGVAVDVDLLGDMSRAFGEKIDSIESEAYEISGHEFNLASPKQLQEVLFNELGLPPQKKTKTGLSTDSEVLETLALMHPLPALLVEHRTLSKLKGTYLDALPKLVNSETGRLHTSFNQAVAVTGRLSSSNPNLQNIPIRSDLGRDIRRAFIAPEGVKIVSADYSQVELRVLAHLSGDPELVDAFRTGTDIHSRTARALFGYDRDEEISPERRAQAKAVNFGVIYGKGEFSLAKELGIPRSEAKRFIEEYFNLYSGVAKFMDETIEIARRDRVVSTMLGRRRPLRDIDSRNHNARQQAERMARNTPIQGTAADLLKVAMIRVDERLTREKSEAKMILTVHDELVFEVPAAQVDETVEMIRYEMEHALELSVPLIVDVGVGNNWAEAH